MDMNTQKSKIKIVMPIVAGCLFSGSVFAADTVGGVVSFSGAVTDTTCNITNDGGKDFTVIMHPGSFDTISYTAGIDSESTEFSINVSGCEGFEPTSITPQPLKITLLGANVSSDNKYLTNVSGSATGIGVALTTNGSTPVVMNEKILSGLATTSSDGTNYDTGASGAIKFHAHYYNYGGARNASNSKGTVLTNVTYMFSYD